MSTPQRTSRKRNERERKLRRLVAVGRAIARIHTGHMEPFRLDELQAVARHLERRNERLRQKPARAAAGAGL